MKIRNWCAIRFRVIDIPGSSGLPVKLIAVEHQTVVEPSAQTLHHETVFQFCYHHKEMMCQR